jgi:hypothetical protein
MVIKVKVFLLYHLLPWLSNIIYAMTCEQEKSAQFCGESLKPSPTSYFLRKAVGG